MPLFSYRLTCNITRLAHLRQKLLGLTSFRASPEKLHFLGFSRDFSFHPCSEGIRLGAFALAPTHTSRPEPAHDSTSQGFRTSLSGDGLVPDAVACASAVAACGRSRRWALAVVAWVSECGIGLRQEISSPAECWSIGVFALLRNKMRMAIVFGECSGYSRRSSGSGYVCRCILTYWPIPYVVVKRGGFVFGCCGLRFECVQPSCSGHCKALLAESFEHGKASQVRFFGGLVSASDGFGLICWRWNATPAFLPLNPQPRKGS